jgi:RNA polymerase sigma-70 factor (ECF subfamily)
VTDIQQKEIFEQWLGSHKGLIFKFVHAYAFTAMDKEDLFQEIMFQVWRSIPSFRGESAPSTWLYRIAMNTSIQWKKKENRQMLTNALHVAELHLHESDTHSDSQLTWIYSEIGKMNPIDRSIALMILDGLSYKEMATILGITESNVGVKINRIKKVLVTKSKNYSDGI